MFQFITNIIGHDLLWFDQDYDSLPFKKKWLMNYTSFTDSDITTMTNHCSKEPNISSSKYCIKRHVHHQLHGHLI